MTEWEYAYTTESNAAILAIVRDAINKAPIALPSQLEKLGRTGWELVAITNADENALVWRLIFKRPK